MRADLRGSVERHRLRGPDRRVHHEGRLEREAVSPRNTVHPRVEQLLRCLHDSNAEQPRASESTRRETPFVQ